MARYIIEIKEIVTHRLFIEADSEQEAIASLIPPSTLIEGSEPPAYRVPGININRCKCRDIRDMKLIEESLNVFEEWEYPG